MKKIIESRKLLGVDKDVELKDLKTIYRNAMKEWHPDKIQDNVEAKLAAEEKSKAFIEAYHLLVSVAPETHEQQIENAKQVEDYLRNKYTQEELYGWMQGEIATIYFQCYQLAYDLAKKAEKTYRYELGIESSSFIQFGIWDSFRKGLMSGERLYLQLKQMEKAYMDHNLREYEITKHVSLAQLDPLAFIKLRATGIADFEIPEILYSIDFPSHYFRRIKSVSVSIPCIAGPYTSVSAQLFLLKSKYSKKPKLNPGDDDVVKTFGAIQSISTSHAQNDSGMFELNFRDERYLPFEGSGAESSWRLELPTKVKQFDYNSISDVIMHVKYTAREGGELLKNAVNNELKKQLTKIKQGLKEEGLHIPIDMKHDMPNEWHLLKNDGSIKLVIDKSRMPYLAQSIAIKIEHVMFITKVKNSPSSFGINIDTNLINTTKNIELDLCIGKSTEVDLGIPFKLSLDKTKIEELIMVVKFEVK